MFSLFKKKNRIVEETQPEMENVQETSPVEVHFKCPTCGRTDTKYLGVTPEMVTVCDRCGYKEVDEDGVERVYYRFIPDDIATHKVYGQ